MARLRSEFGSLRQAATPPRGSGGSTAGGLPRGPALKLFRGERDISGLVWPFTPTPGSSPPFSTDVGAGLHGVSPPLRPAPGWLARLRVRGRRLNVALFGLAFAAARLNLRLAAGRDSLAHSSIGTPSHPGGALRLLAGARFQALFHSPPGVLFTFPSRYWSAVGRRGVLSLGGRSPLLPAGFLVPGGTRDRVPGPAGCAYGALTLCRAPSHASSAPQQVCDPGRTVRGAGDASSTPAARRAHAGSRRRFGLAPFRSPLLGGSLIDFPSSGYLDVSVPPVAPRRGMRSQGG